MSHQSPKNPKKLFWGSEWSLSVGQALVEFTLALLVLLWLTIGLFDLGRGVVALYTIQEVAQEGARYGAVHFGEDGWHDAAAQSARRKAVGIDSLGLQIVVTSKVVGGVTYVETDVRYVFRTLTPLAGNVLGETLNLSSGTSMVARAG